MKRRDVWYRRTSLRTCVAWIVICSCDSSARADPDGPVSVTPTASAPTEAQQRAADRHVGAYRHAGGQAERDAVDAAIEDVVADMNFLARGTARDRLREANPVPKRIAITRTTGTLTVAFDERTYDAPLDGSKTRVTGITGDELEYHVTVDDTRLRQHFAGPRGGRRNTMRHRGEDRMVLNVKVTSDSLPKPLEYVLTFKRDGA